MTPEWITAGCALVVTLITVAGILINPLKKLNSKLDDLDKHTKELDTNQKAMLGVLRSVASEKEITVLDSVVTPSYTPGGRK